MPSRVRFRYQLEGVDDGWVDPGLLFGPYVLTSPGITVDFHRLFTYRSFETYRVVSRLTMAKSYR